MIYYRPEQWSELDSKVLAYLKRRGLLPAYDYVVSTMEHVWSFLDAHHIILHSDEEYDDPSHPLNFYYSIAYDSAFTAFGAYNALLCATVKNDEVHDAIYNWGHYSVFY